MAEGSRRQCHCEPIVEIEFEKAIQEVEAPASGTLTRVLAAENETVPVNSPIAEIESAD